MKRLIGCMAALCLLALTGCNGVTNNGTLAYVSNSNGTGFTVFTVNTNGTLTPAPASPVSTPVGPKVIQFSANGRWAYFLDAAGQYIYAYTRSANGELPIFIGETMVNGASSMVIAPNNNYLYVAEPSVTIPGSTETGDLVVFSIDPTTGLLGAGLAADVGYPITQLVMNPSGSLLFGLSPGPDIVAHGANTVVSWQLSGTNGSATEEGTLPQGKELDYMVLSANGSYMYLLDRVAATPLYPNSSGGPAGNSPIFYAYDVGSNGVLSPLLGQSISPVFNENADLASGIFPENPVGGVTSSDSRYLFIANQNGWISVFSIAATTSQGMIPGQPKEVQGALVTVNGSQTSTASPFPCGTGCSPSFAAVPKTDNALYVLSESTGNLYQFSVDENTGVLRPLVPPSVPTGSQPTWITIY